METWRHIIEQIKSGDKNQFLEASGMIVGKIPCL